MRCVELDLCVICCCLCKRMYRLTSVNFNVLWTRLKQRSTIDINDNRWLQMRFVGRKIVHSHRIWATNVECVETIFPLNNRDKERMKQATVVKEKNRIYSWGGKRSKLVSVFVFVCKWIQSWMSMLFIPIYNVIR